MPGILYVRDEQGNLAEDLELLPDIGSYEAPTDVSPVASPSLPVAAKVENAVMIDEKYLSRSVSSFPSHLAMNALFTFASRNASLESVIFLTPSVLRRCRLDL